MIFNPYFFLGSSENCDDAAAGLEADFLSPTLCAFFVLGESSVFIGFFLFSHVWLGVSLF